MTLQIVAIDDEQSALDIIRKFADSCEQIEELFTFHDPLKGFDFLREEQSNISALIIDMDMPELHGLEIVKEFSSTLPIIISSAHTEYAAKGFDYQVIDFLSKPFSYARFIKAIDKLINQKNIAKKNVEQNQNDQRSEFVYVKHDGEIHKVMTAKIEYLEAYGNYVKVMTSDKTYLVNITMKQFESRLPKNFFRIHKSHIVNIDHMTRLVGTQLYLSDQKLTVGKAYKQALLSYLKDHSFGKL